MLTLTQRLPANPGAIVMLTLALTAEERCRSRYRLETPELSVSLQLPRGTVLHDGDLLQPANGEQFVRVVAKPEPVYTVSGQTPLDLLRAAYHLGNRHVPLEITSTYLKLAPDPVLRSMLEQLGIEVREEISPFQPEAGAYGHSH
ncbi:urease accessory protein UreE [Microcoleus sp. FACHB-672]|uniref:urease accessory protein UreE n=1 Tax=Microcoleus sp. FACHB-672 TaxID=2692825 RepID=UPI001687218B|nr:urease accessory protein UreE [Microcoleus sp. FACHB-672]MBD2041623.1 urease accessory protein UreE [Microcoleus sp. FACHB-672]